MARMVSISSAFAGGRSTIVGVFKTGEMDKTGGPVKTTFSVYPHSRRAPSSQDALPPQPSNAFILLQD
jgi:hypothetical protein